MALLGFWMPGGVAISQESYEMSVATFNIRYANPDDTLRWEDRKDEVANAVRYFDVIGFQEVLPQQKNDLIARMPRHAHYGEGRDRDGTGEACPIFWNQKRFDFLHGEIRWLSDTPLVAGSIGPGADLPRIVTIVLLHDKKTKQTVRVLNTHWSHTSEEAREAASNLMAGWTGWAGEADLTLVCGDFNAEPQSPPISRLLESSDLQDTYDNANFRCRKSFGTYSTFFPTNLMGATRIDAIFYRGNVTVDWVCADELIKYGVYISDHLPYHAVFKIP
tara:strand:- start:843 stop:1670 length:828 start_codon:yes stop_codon:yes gene_type:complete